MTRGAMKSLQIPQHTTVSPPGPKEFAFVRNLANASAESSSLWSGVRVCLLNFQYCLC